ncbi:LexA family protein [Paracidovorax anthurii]|uniref:Peptidase S24-like protein n=1 Tax=Paracidovorax anthurii TaxID=78229 RepID=A0A328ZF77_9BURK|nr:LexA family transcriptional regulator [Paracidovorax anthurii]RAR85010.1 peptidase S24-like protein [Paracidovorax anthurii]
MDSLTKHRKERLRALIDGPPFSGNQAEFARHAGLSKGRINQLLDEQHAFGERSATNLALKLDLSPYYFESGHEFTAMHNSSRDILAGMAGTRPIPLISASQASRWSELVDAFEPHENMTFLLTEQALSSVAFAMEVRDNSMLNEFRPSDQVIIDPAVIPAPGDYVAAANGPDPAILRKYRPRRLDAEGRVVYELSALNDDFPILSSDVQPLLLIGTMVEQRRYRKAP